MPAKTDKQARFMHVVEAAKRGDTNIGGDAKKAARSMSMRQIKDFEKKSYARNLRMASAIIGLTKNAGQSSPVMQKQQAARNHRMGTAVAALLEKQAGGYYTPTAEQQAKAKQEADAKAKKPVVGFRSGGSLPISEMKPKQEAKPIVPPKPAGKEVASMEKQESGRVNYLAIAMDRLLAKQAAIKDIANGDEPRNQTEAELKAEAVNDGAPPASPLKAANGMNPLKGQFGNLPDQKNPAASNCGNRGIGGE